MCGCMDGSEERWSNLDDDDDDDGSCCVLFWKATLSVVGLWD